MPRFNKKSLANAYNVGRKMFDNWFEDLKEELGEYKNRCFTPKQVEIFVENYGPFDGYTTYKQKLQSK